jgi:membrane peptidoglycan carboxypeptidase
MLAAQLTRRYGPRQVLEWYLNSADYGHFAYGVEAAAQFYLGKSVTQLTLSEAALLAAVSQAPALNPVDAPNAAEARRVETLEAMQAQGLIEADEAARAVADQPSLSSPEEGGDGADGEIAPAFVRLALAQLDALFAAGRIQRGGLIVRTSLDYELQVQAACAVRVYLERLSGPTGEPAEPGSGVAAASGASCQAARLLPAAQPGEALPGASASALILDPATGQVLAAVGDVRAGRQAAFLAQHPAGTSITPFIYLTGFSRGLNPASLGWDIPPDADDGAGPALGRVYHGPVRLRLALVNDYLPPAQHVLEQMGPESVRAISDALGLIIPPGVRLLEDDFEISPLDLAAAYGVLANGGTQAGQPVSGADLEPTTVLQVTGLDHAVWLDWTAPHSQPVVSPQLAYLMEHVLGDEAARWPSFGNPSPLEIGRPAGAKASRTLDGLGAWTVGSTPGRVTAVWLGSDGGAGEQPEELAGPVSPRLSADLWHGLMQYAASGLPPANWEAPSGVLTVEVCDPSGMLPSPACPSVVDEVFLEGRQPLQVDSLYQTFQVNIETGLLATVFTPAEQVEEQVYLVVPSEARAWADAAGLPQPPVQYDTLERPRPRPDVHITSPAMFADGRGVLEIRGSAAGADLQSYRLEYGRGLYPTLWTLIGSDVRSPVNEGPLGEWDTSGLDGLYALRLMVVRSDQRVEQAVVQVILDNTPPQVAIAYPAAGAQVSLAQEPQLALQAQVNDPFLEKVEFYLDGDLVEALQAAPYGALWEARTGTHILRVVAVDRAGNTTEASLNFTVKR